MTFAGAAESPRVSGKLAIAAASSLFAFALALASQEAKPLPVKLETRGGRVFADIDVAPAFAPSIERELGNGLTNVVAIYVTIVPTGGGPALAYGRIIDILFDVWEERYVLTVKDPRTPNGARIFLPDFASLRSFLSDERGLDIGPSSLLPEGTFVTEVRVEVNPVSKELLHRTREFIANPPAGPHAASGSRSVLGAMAGFLLREPDPGSDVHLFRSRPIGRDQVPAR